MNWQQLLKNKKLLWGVAAAGGLGLVVFLRKGGAGSTAAAADVAGGSGSIGNPASLDTTGTDLAAALGNFSQDLQGQLTDFGGTITDALKNIPTGAGSVTTTPAPTPKPAPKPVVKPKPKPKPTSKSKSNTVTVAKYTSHNAPWNSTLSGIAAHYKTSVSTLLRLNPSVKNRNKINAGQKIRYR